MFYFRFKNLFTRHGKGGNYGFYGDMKLRLSFDSTIGQALIQFISSKSKTFYHTRKSRADLTEYFGHVDHMLLIGMKSVDHLSKDFVERLILQKTSINFLHHRITFPKIASILQSQKAKGSREKQRPKGCCKQV